jgi:hypothetical protein
VECRAHVPAEDSTSAHASSNAHLSAEALDKIPELPAFQGERFVLGPWAFRALRGARRAIVAAPAELPVGESGQAFFSASSISAPAMYFV